VVVDGDPTQSSETTEPVATPVETPVALDAEQPGPQPEPQREPEPEAQAERLSVEQLCDYVARARFATTFGRRGYQQSEVDALLVNVAGTLRAGAPLADLVRHTHLTHVRLEDGYDTSQVDDFLAAVVDLDPHADARPEVARGGLIGKLFG
jgi:DivIVA domain-containing protein